MKPWLRSLAYVLVSYVGLVLMLLALENKLLFRPARAVDNWTPPPPEGNIEDIDLTCADGTRIHAWWCADANSDRALLYLHGNAGNLSWRGNSIVKLRNRLGVSVLIVDYPGYGKSDGAPTEQGCYQAADAGYDWIVSEKKVPAGNLILYGGSLGGGAAVDLASRREHRALVLVKTFTSAPDAARSVFWWLPVPMSWLMTNRFDNLEKIRQCRRPVFITHGTTDEVIPYVQGERLFEAANEPKRFLALPGNGHNDPLPDEFFRSLREFLDTH